MIKSILNLEGVQTLSKEVQKEVNGGRLVLRRCCDPSLTCCFPTPSGSCRYSFSSGNACI